MRNVKLWNHKLQTNQPLPNQKQNNLNVRNGNLHQLFSCIWFLSVVWPPSLSNQIQSFTVKVIEQYWNFWITNVSVVCVKYSWLWYCLFGLISKVVLDLLREGKSRGHMDFTNLDIEQASKRAQQLPENGCIPELVQFQLVGIVMQHWKPKLWWQSSTFTIQNKMWLYTYIPFIDSQMDVNRPIIASNEQQARHAAHVVKLPMYSKPIHTNWQKKSLDHSLNLVGNCQLHWWLDYKTKNGMSNLNEQLARHAAHFAN